MCYEHYHHCRFCKKKYYCDEDNDTCPTINSDSDTNLCEECKIELEKILGKFKLVRK